MKKCCSACNTYKNEDEFNFRKRTYNGETKIVLNSICRECNNIKSKEYYYRTKNTKLDNISSVFIRHRGNRYIVYIQGKKGNKTKQVNKGSFVEIKEAELLKEELINKYINKDS